MRVIAQLIQACLGVWLMASPDVLEFSGAPANHYQIVGPIIAAFAGVAVGECTHNVRLWVVPFAGWMIAAPLLFTFPTPAMVNGIVTGAAMLSLCFVRGKVRDRYAGGWSVLFKSDPYHVSDRGSEYEDDRVIRN